MQSTWVAAPAVPMIEQPVPASAVGQRVQIGHSTLAGTGRRPAAVALAAAVTCGARRMRRSRGVRRQARGGRQDASKPRVAVIGAGWGGLGAAKALCENGCEVILMDGNAIGGETLTSSGKPFEAGTRGFWRDYPNLNEMLASLGIAEEDIYSDFTESAFYSPDGLEATAPVFGSEMELPSPLGQVFASFSRFTRLPLQDRLSISGLLLAMLDYDRDEKTFEKYDRMTAHELFIRAGLSKRLVDDFLKPTLLVGLFKPPEELSAAVAMELLYFYALAHQNSFDVRWLRRGTVSTTMVKPLVEQLVEEYDMQVEDGTFVNRLELEGNKVVGLKSTTGEQQDLDAVVMALGAGGMRSIAFQTPELARRWPGLSKAAALGGIDVMAVRIWLDKTVPTATPANVFSRFEALRGAGGTFFMLDQLQEGNEEELWAGEVPQGSVVACDFYNAGALLPLADEEIVRILMEELLPAAIPDFSGARVVDSEVKKYGRAVSWFSPGSFKSRPTTETPVANLVCAGDWVRLGDREHGAKGLCQERAYVTGLEAANSLARRGILGNGHKQEHEVIPVRDDEPQVQLGRELAKGVAGIAKPFGLDSPWVR